MSKAFKKVSDIEIALSRLAALAGVPMEWGWMSDLSRKMGLSVNTFQGWIKRGECSSRGLLKIIAKGFPIEDWLVTAAPYETAPERMLPETRGGPQRDPDHGSYGAHDLSRFKVVQVIDPSQAVYVHKVQQILSSPEKATVEALKANIDQFYEKLQDKTRLLALDQRIGSLEKEIKRLKNDDGCSVSDPAAEMECAE